MRATDPDPESSAERHFIELATRSLEGQPEVRDEARGELMERLGAQNPEQRDAAIGHALGQLAKVVPGQWRGKAATLGLLWLALSSVAAWQGFQIYHAIKSAKDQAEATSDWERKWESLSDRSQSFSESERNFASAKLRFLSDPGEYEAFLDSTELRPTGYIMVWPRVDPGNGALTWRAAMEMSNRWHNAPLYDSYPAEGDYRAAWKYAAEATQAPRFHFYGRERRASWWKQWHEPETHIDLYPRIGFHKNRMPWLRDSAGYLFEERAKRLIEAKDQEGLRSTIRTWEQLCLRVATEGGDLDDLFELIAAGQHLKSAARHLGMTAEESKIQNQITLSGMPGHRSHGAAPPEMGKLASRLYDTGLLAHAPLADPSSYLPGRMAEHAYYDRIAALAAAILLLPILGAVALESVRRGKRVNGLATGLAPLFKGRDGLWLVGLGVLLPFAWHWGITRLTPLGLRDVNLSASGYAVNLFHGAASLLLMLVLTLQAGHWRLARRCGFLGLSGRHLWIGWTVAAIAAALLPLAAVGQWLPKPHLNQFVRIYQATCGIPLLWLFWRAGALAFGPNANALGGVLLARATALPLVFAVAALLGCYPLLLASEKNWVAQDEVTGWDASRGMTKQEARSIDAVVARCREVFGDSPSAPPAQ